MARIQVRLLESGSITSVLSPGVPVVGATVTLEETGSTGITDSRGVCTFSLPYSQWASLVRRKGFTVVARHGQYHTLRQTYTLKTSDILSESVTLTLFLARVGPGQAPSPGPVPVVFFVRDRRSGNLVGGARLVIQGGGTEYVRVAGDGTVKIDLLQDVEYTVRTSAPGYRESVIRVVP
ncbi:MAG: hypothetical protein QXD60_01005 [Nanopusillaceae archaeon]